jgi:hypothetical protein
MRLKQHEPPPGITRVNRSIRIAEHLYLIGLVYLFKLEVHIVCCEGKRKFVLWSQKRISLLEGKWVSPSKMLSTDRRIETYRRLLAVAHMNPHPEKEEQNRQLTMLAHKFKLLLAQKAREEAVHDICDDDGGNTKHARARETDNARPRVCVGDILQKKVAGC